jgi:hypothetical protein
VVCSAFDVQGRVFLFGRDLPFTFLFLVAVEVFSKHENTNHVRVGDINTSYSEEHVEGKPFRSRNTASKRLALSAALAFNYHIYSFCSFDENYDHISN